MEVSWSVVRPGGSAVIDADGANIRLVVEVECTGTTVDGRDAVLTGVTSEIPGASITELEGDWTATVGGEQVFATDELGG